MTDLLHPAADAPQAVFDRPHATPEIHRVPLRETAAVAVEVAPGELPAAVGTALAEVEAAMAEAGVALAGPPFTRYLAYEPRVRAEIGFPVLRPAPHVGRVFPGRLPGGRVASIVHVGAFDGLHQTYAVLFQWLTELGLQPTGATWEVYWSDPEAEPDPATWRTEILAPVE
jgi:effector-binding domain-containing protein